MMTKGERGESVAVDENWVFDRGEDDSINIVAHVLLHGLQMR